MSEPAKSDRIAKSTDKDHTQVLDMLNSAEMQTRLEEARARREKVLAERASTTQEEPPRPAIVQAAATARMVDAGRTPLLLVEPMRKPPLRQVLPRQVTAKPVPQLAASRPEPVASRPEPVALRAEPVTSRLEPVVLRAEPVVLRPEPVASRPKPAALRPEPAPQRRRRFQPSGLVMGLAFGVAAGAGLMQFMGPETPRRPVVPGTDTDQAPARIETPAGLSAAAAGSSQVEPSGSDQAVIPRARPDKRPDVGLIVLPKVASPEAAVPDVIAPPADSRPEVVAATADIVPTTPPARIPPLVTLHLSSDLSDDTLADVRSALREAGTGLAATRVAGFGVAKSEVRFFHERDAEDARRIAERMGTVARDFSTYRPVPPPGTLEVWLAGGG